MPRSLTTGIMISPIVDPDWQSGTGADSKLLLESGSSDDLLLESSGSLLLEN